MYPYGQKECWENLCPVHKLDKIMMRKVYAEILIKHYTVGERKSLEDIANSGMLPDDGHKVLDEESIDVMNKVAAVAKYYAEDAAKFVSEMEGH